MQQSLRALQLLRGDIVSSIAAKLLRRTGRFVPVANASKCPTVSALAVCSLCDVVTAVLMVFLVYLCETSPHQNLFSASKHLFVAATLDD